MFPPLTHLLQHLAHILITYPHHNDVSANIKKSMEDFRLENVTPNKVELVETLEEEIRSDLRKSQERKYNKNMYYKIFN